MEVRSSLSCATVRPRYSVSSTAVELRNSSVSSATEASLFAMWLLNFVDALRCDVHRTRPPGRDPTPLTKKAPAQAHGAGESRRVPDVKLHTPARAPAREQDFDRHARVNRSEE